MGDRELDVRLTSYQDYFSHWFGLKDGTLTDVADVRGSWWVKVDGHVMPAEQFNG